MEIFVSDIYKCLIQWAPIELAEDWDNSGLQLGNFSQRVENIFLTLDLSLNSLDEAINHGANLIITHHPFLFKPIKSINLSTLTGQLIKRLISLNISVISMHTNLDKAKDGVSHCLSKIIGITDPTPILPEKEDPTLGLGLVGSLQKPRKLEDIISSFKQELSIQHVKVVGELKRDVEKIALCGGSGSDLWEIIKDKGIDLYISAEIKHHIAVEAKDIGICLIDLGHYHSEYLILGEIQKFLQDQAVKNNWDIKIIINKNETSPFNIY